MSKNPKRLYAERVAYQGHTKMGIWVDDEKTNIYEAGLKEGRDARKEWDVERQCWKKKDKTLKTKIPIP